VGCGAGGMLARLSDFGAAAGVDPSPVAVAYAQRKGLDAQVGSLPDALPFAPPTTFNVITLLDVLEHVEDDAAALRSLRRLLATEGRLFLTVPAFPVLWSGHDVANEHRRRYRLRPLRNLLAAAGFDVIRISYCNTALFLPIAAWRTARRILRPQSIQPKHATADIRPVARPLNTLLHHVFAAERFMIGAVPLPFGVSLLAVARPATPR
jgi:SAM-dependent methyltransferase